MGTTDNFDSTAAASVPSTATLPILLASNAGARTAGASLIAPYTGRYRYCTIEGNLGTLSSLGTSTTVTADKTYYADIFIPLPNMVITGIGFLNGTTATTDKAIVSLYNAAGTLLANSVVTGGGTLIATSNIFQQVAFTAPYTTLNPGRFWIGYQQNGTTATPRTIATATWVNVLTGSATGTNAVAAPTITPPTTFTADVGPIAYVY
jgi:hypothetical protein